MAMSLKTGIEHRFSSGKFKSTVQLHVLLGKLRNFTKFSHAILKYSTIGYITVYKSTLEVRWRTHIVRMSSSWGNGIHHGVI